MPANADVLHSSAPHVRKSLVGVMTRNESTRRIFEDGKYEQEIDQFLRYCAPMISVSKRGLREIHMRNTNWLYRSNFNNNLQKGQRRFRGGSVSENHARGSVSWSSAKFSAILAGSKQKAIEDYYLNNKKAEEIAVAPPSNPHKLAAKGGRRSPNNSPNNSPGNSVRKLNV